VQQIPLIGAKFLISAKVLLLLLLKAPATAALTVFALAT